MTSSITNASALGDVNCQQISLRRKNNNGREVMLVTKAECMEIVRQTLELDKVNIVDYKIEAASEEILGFLGEYLRLTITIQNKDNNLEEIPYFLKSLPVDEQHRKLIENIGLFKKEVQLYSILLPKLKWNSGISKWRPNCYLSRYNLLIMEELNHLGYSHTPDRTEFTKNQIQETLKCVARMHASSLEFEQNCLNGERIDYAYGDLLFDGPLQEGNSWFLAGLDLITAIAVKRTIYRNHPNIDELPSRLRQIYKFRESNYELRNVLCHRDLWDKNIMFKFKKDQQGNIDYKQPEHCLILDFQICRYSPPVVDVLFCIFFNTRKSHRSVYLNDYLKFYYDQLRFELQQFNIKVEDKILWDELTRSLETHMLMALIFNCIYTPLTALAPGTLNKLQKIDPSAYHILCDIDRTAFVLDIMNKDDYYRDIVIEVMEELLDHILNE